jgi:hypothetical protein
LKNSTVLKGDLKVENGEWEKVLLVREWTEPKDGEKEVFFRNLAGVVMEPKPVVSENASWLLRWLWGWWIEWQVWIVGAEGDNFTAVLGGKGGWVEWVVVHAICLLVVALGKTVGLKGRYDEYTPVELRKEKAGRKRN